MKSIGQNYWDEKVISEGNYPEYISDGGKYHTFKTIITALSFLPSDKKVLDVGCGSGFSTYFYYPYCKELQGVDYSKEAIKKARERYPHIAFFESEITSLPFKDKEFDVVLCQNVLHHLIKTTDGEDLTPFLFRAIEEMDRVSNGLILVSEANALNPLRKYKEKKYYPKIKRNEQSYSLSRWKRIFAKFGYEITHSEYFTFLPYELSNKMIHFLKPIENLMETIPLINKTAGGIFFVCEKKKRLFRT